MNIAFATDRGYIAHMASSIFSLIENIKNKNLNINIYIINKDITKNELELIKSINKNTNIKFIDKKINDTDIYNIKTTFHFNISNYYRLFIQDFIEEEKVLYIDSDTIINKDITELWNINIDETYLAAVEDVGFDRHQQLRMDKNSNYFNSGVMLINIKKWREDLIKEKVIQFVKENEKEIIFADQCGLNAIINGRWKQIHPKFNVQSVFFELAQKGNIPNGFEKIIEAIADLVILHYTGSGKPWHFLNTHPCKKKYWTYRNQTPFKRIFPENIVRDSLKWCIPDWAKTILKKINHSC